MGKIDSLEFLDSFIEQIDSLTDEEVEMYKKNYQNELNNKIQQQQFDFIPPFNENDIDIKDKLRLAICMSQSKWSGLIYNTKKTMKNLMLC